MSRMLSWLTKLAQNLPARRRCHVPRRLADNRRRTLCLEPLDARLTLAVDILYVGDAATDTVQKFDALTYSATFGRANSAMLDYEDPPSLSGIETSPLVLNGPLTNGPYSGRVSDAIVVSDLDGGVNRAVIRISGNYRPDQDRLDAGFTDFGNIVPNWDATTGTLTLQGHNTVEVYSNALRYVIYSNDSATPDLARRTVTFSVSDSPTDSNTVSRDVVLLPDDLHALFFTERWFVANRTFDLVTRMDTTTGARSGNFALPGREEGGLLLANQTTLIGAGRNLAPFVGEGEEGSFFDGGATHGAIFRLPDRTMLVSDTTATAPVDPEGLVLDGDVLYVADTRSSPLTTGDIPAGRIRRYKLTTGEFL
ncbi:MAG: hypothetical protein AB7O38_26570, partial [Pirellulaceae bacterium]